MRLAAMSDEINPYAAPQSEVLTQPVDPASFPLASRWRRLFASFFDVVATVIVLMPLAFAYFIYQFGWAGFVERGGFSFNTSETGWAVVAFFVGLGINWVFLANGQTLGQKLLGIRVVLVNDSPCDRARYILRREVPIHVWSKITFLWLHIIITLVDCLMIFRSDKRTLHDMIAGTKVVDIRPRIG